MKTTQATIKNLNVGDMVTCKPSDQLSQDSHRLESGYCYFEGMHTDANNCVFVAGMTGFVTGIKVPGILTGKYFVVVEWGVCNKQHNVQHKTAFWYADLLKVICNE